MKEKRNNYITTEEMKANGVMVGDKYIYTDPYNFIVADVNTVSADNSKEENLGKLYLNNFSYHATLQQAVNKLLTEAEIDNIQDLNAILKSHRDVVQRLDRLTELKRKKNA